MDAEIDYEVRAAFQPLHLRKERWAVVVAHRRSGKTVAAINELIGWALRSTKPSPRYAYLAPYRQQAKLVAWDYLKRYTKDLVDRQVAEGELHVKLPNDARVTLYGADNYDALRGIYLDGIVVDEPADMGAEVWQEVIRPALADRGGWCVWIGTPKGRNAFWRLYQQALSDPTYYSLFLPASVSGLLPKAELESAKKAMGDASYAREFECDFSAAIAGSIYGSNVAALTSARRIVDFAHEVTHSLFTFWDLGQSDYTCIWLAQLVGRDILLLDYHSATGQTPAYYADVTRAWEARYDKRVAVHYLPHDGYTKDRSGRSWIDDLKDAGLREMRVVPRIPDKWIGINHLRAIFPRLYIHKSNCSKGFGEGEFALPSGLDCLEYYHKREITQSGMISEEPMHDEFSHGADAIRTLAESDLQHMLEGTSEMGRSSKVFQSRANRAPSYEEMQQEVAPRRRFNQIANR